MTPEIKDIAAIGDISYESQVLKNGHQLIWIDDKNLDLVKIDIVFAGGRSLETKRFSSKITSLMLKEDFPNTKNINFNLDLETYGASVASIVDMDFIGMKVICLSEYFDKIVELMFHQILNFDIDLNTLKRKKKKAIEKVVEHEDSNEMMSYRLFTEKVFGKEHMYGYNSQIEDIEAISEEDIMTYLKRTIAFGQVKVFLAGKLSQSNRDFVIYFLNKLQSVQRQDETKILFEPNKKDFFTFDAPQKSLASIKIGRNFGPHISESEKQNIHIANTLIGGFFGSNLIKEIREHKGYTYSIFSSYDNFRHDSLFLISTEVQKKNVDKTIEAIAFELQKLIEKRISDEKESILKRYLKGNLLSLTDGTFNRIRLIENLLMEGNDTKYVYDFFHKVETISKEELKETIKRFFAPEDLTYVILK